MAFYDQGYEVAWQLSEEGEEPVVDLAMSVGSVSRENLESLARFSGLLAGAEVAAVALCRGEGLIIEVTDPPTSWLAAGMFVRAQPPNDADEGWSIGSLLTGSSRWCWCKPPDGFCSAALVRGPWLVASQRLLLVANRDTRLSEVNLGLAASYLAQASRSGPGAMSDNVRRTVAETGAPPADDVRLSGGAADLPGGDHLATRAGPGPGGDGRPAFPGTSEPGRPHGDVRL